jgi:DNA-directed RNA polymerase subunit alpha
MSLFSEKAWVRYTPVTENHGKFVVEPLGKGYGATLGNALRRVLLSSISGAAITNLRVEGATHPFSTIPGVVEDILQVILNVKEIVLRSYADAPNILKLEGKGPTELIAGNLEHDAEVEIVNPNHKIATLESGSKVAMEFTVEKGTGYVTTEANKKPNLPIGSIPIDSIFGPVQKVNIATEEVRVGQAINYDRLILEVWTNGAVHPDDAVREAAKILQEHISLFLHLGEKPEAAAAKVDATVGVDESILDMPIEDLELSARSQNCLKKAEIKTVRELIRLTDKELREIKNFGARSADEVHAKLAEYGLKLTLESEG